VTVEGCIAGLKALKSGVIALDGMACAGKTTLAARLADALGARVIHMDDFFLPPEMRTAERLAIPGENIHWERLLRDVLEPLRAGRAAVYRPYDCQRQAEGPSVAVPPGGLVLVEGVYALHPRLAPFYDYRIFLQVSPATQARRVAARETPAQAARYLDTWIPLENRYFAAFDVQNHCDAVLNGEDYR
jgi:uridine kinase